MLCLRPARLDEPDALVLIAEVQRWYVEIYGGEDHDPLAPNEFAPPRGGFLLGHVDGEPVAMGGWTRIAGTADAKLRRMSVRPSFQRRGYAGALLGALEDDAARAGAWRMLLTTGAPQVAAIAFYRARGYTDVPPFGFYAGSPSAVHLARPLTVRGEGRPLS